MKRLNLKPFCFLFLTGAFGLCGNGLAYGQAASSKNDLSLNSLSDFKNPGKSWQMAGGVNADLNKENFFNLVPGANILVNQPDKKNPGMDLYSIAEHGDADIELDYLMAKGANSGIYLQSRYELQLEDSWNMKNPTAANNGGIYQRWNDSKPEGQKGYEGSAPRQNVSKAPGLWQHLKIAFQAPKFDANGKKIENARMLKVELNGVTIHENVELTGPTRGSVSNEEKALAPLRIQGDHGAVAFRNIRITNYTSSREAAAENNQRNVVDPILVEAPVNTILRSFVDIGGNYRVTHAVSVGSPDMVHYTYDLDHGTIVQVWRGGFLDATPMWHSRGNGSSRALGTVQRFGKPVLMLAKLSNEQAAWVTDTIGSSYRPKGYVMDAENRPVFKYQVYGVDVTDASQVIENGRGIKRVISIKQPVAGMYARLAEGASIEALPGNLYLVDDKAFYLRLDNANGAKPVIRDSNGRKELIIAMRDQLSYSILF